MEDCSDEKPLAGVSICVVPGDYLAGPHLRFVRETQALHDAGARLTAVMYNLYDTPEPLPADIEIHLTHRKRPPLSELIPASHAAWRPLRIVGNITGIAIRHLLSTNVFGRPVVDWFLGPERDEVAILEQLAPTVDVVWAIGFYWGGLSTAVAVARRHRLPVVYETIDLEPEANYKGWGRSRALATEARLMAHVSGFVTACDSYADYYEERYGDRADFRRPVVHDNAPGSRVPSIRPTGRERRFFFIGHLLPRIMVLVEACALADPAVTLTFQGENRLGSLLHDRIDELGLGNRVHVLEPCPREAILDAAAHHDVGMVALPRDNENNRRASSTKLFTYMAAGLAVLGSDTPGVARLVNKHNNGLLVSEDSPRAWAAAFDEIASMPSNALDELKQRSLSASDEYTWERQRPHFVNEFRRALVQE